MTGKRWIAGLAFAAALLAWPAALAEDLAIEGLGILPFGKDIQIADGQGSAVEAFLKKRAAGHDYRLTGNAAMFELLAVPPGMHFFPEKDPSPYGSLHLYQLHTGDVRGYYSAMVLVFQGDEETLFGKGNKKIKRFWDHAFRQDVDRPTSLFGRPKITLDEFQSMANRYLEEKKGAQEQLQILSFTPWHGYRNEDGSYRWTQEAKVILSGRRGLAFPLWVSSALFKNKDRYYLIVACGSHMASEKLGGELLYGAYRLQRSME